MFGMCLVCGNCPVGEFSWLVCDLGSLFPSGRLSIKKQYEEGNICFANATAVNAGVTKFFSLLLF